MVSVAIVSDTRAYLERNIISVVEGGGMETDSLTGTGTVNWESETASPYKKVPMNAEEQGPFSNYLLPIWGDLVFPLYIAKTRTV